VIEIASLTEADRGRWVRLSREPYTNPGRILRWNDSHIFILWHRGQFEKSLDHTQRAVAPEDLEFLDDDPQGEPQKSWRVNATGNGNATRRVDSSPMNRALMTFNATAHRRFTSSAL
jgi:hypothetical protein